MIAASCGLCGEGADRADKSGGQGQSVSLARGVTDRDWVRIFWSRSYRGAARDRPSACREDLPGAKVGGGTVTRAVSSIA